MGVPLNLSEIYSGFFSADAYNNNNQLIEEAVGKALDRTGATDNAMEVDLDMGLHNIFNLKKAVLSHQAVPLEQLLDVLSEGGVDSLVFMEPRLTAVGGETVIPFEVIEYTPLTNSLMVFVNGVYQRANFEYQETGTREITFTPALSTGDVVDIFGSKYDAQQYVNLAIEAANTASADATAANQSATDAQSSADIAISAAGYKLDVNNQVGTSYTLQLADEGDFVRMDNAAANTVIVPTNTAVPFEIGTIVLVRQIGEGTTTIQPSIGVTVNAPFNNYDISQNDFGIALVKVSTDEWDMVKAFGGVDTSDLVAFSQEFDARLQDFYQEILSVDPTFVVNFEALQNNVDGAIASLQSEFATLESNTNQAVTDLTAAFNVIDADFTSINNQFTTIQSGFSTIQSDFSTIQSDFSTIQSDFSTIQSDFVGFETLIADTNAALDSLNLDGTFENALFEDGYQKLPGGMIMQWGKTKAIPSDQVISVNLPIAFPTACLNITGSALSSVTSSVDNAPRFLSYNSSSFVVKNEGMSSANGNIQVLWSAIGY